MNHTLPEKGTDALASVDVAVLLQVQSEGKSSLLREDSSWDVVIRVLHPKS